VNPYAKIAIKIAVVIVICLVLLVAYNLVGHRTYVAAARRARNEGASQERIAQRLDSLLQYKDILPQIRQVQIQDIQTIRNVIPDADEFVLTSYLRTIHGMLAESHLETDGITIGGRQAAVGGTDFRAAFASEVSALQDDLDRITGALQGFRDNMGHMNNMLASFAFYYALGTGAENFRAIAGGIESHSFSLTVRGSYADIKKFTYDIFNMRPRTALVGLQMAPQGPGIGATRMYAARFRLITYGDANNPPPLWVVLNGPTTLVPPAQAGGEE